MEAQASDFVKLYRDLTPDGRAYRVPFGSTYEEFITALAQGKLAVYNTSANILDVIYADNANFTLQDAHDWYVRLGIYDSGSVTLDDMKSAINAKYSRLNAIYYRQDKAFVQTQLRAAGFDVYVYENRFLVGSSYVTLPPSSVIGTAGVKAVSGFFQSGQAQFGQTTDLNVSLCVTYLEEEKDNVFDVGDNLYSTFYIAGPVLATFAQVPTVRKTEFRQLILSLKQAQAVAYLFVQYV